MSKPNALLYNFTAQIIKVPSPDSLTALVDMGFRQWSMRNFRLAGVSASEPRSVQKGPMRDEIKKQLLQQRVLLESILMPQGRKGVNILLSPEKPSYAGNFAANVFTGIKGKFIKDYCVKYQDYELFDVTAIMRDVCSGATAIEVAISFIRDVSPTSFER